MVEQLISEVRNDTLNREVPEEAKKALRHLMNTEYGYDIRLVKEFLEAVYAEGSRIKEHLGYVEIDENNPTYAAMLSEDKEVQEAKNRDIDDSIAGLEAVLEHAEKLGQDDPSLFMPHVYVNNDRYMADLNVAVPQTDKVARFFITPKNHRLNYKISKNDKGALLFTVEADNDLEADQSYTVRLALAEGVGFGVDKKNAKKVIEFGDALLSIPSAKLPEVKKSITSRE